MQFVCAVVWLASVVVASFGTEQQAFIAFLTATFLCQIVFGIYAMLCESRRRKQMGAVHA
jgi:peptidoglycan/LPS O-acetylase OafA/YrhL